MFAFPHISDASAQKSRKIIMRESHADRFLASNSGFPALNETTQWPAIYIGIALSYQHDHPPPSQSRHPTVSVTAIPHLSHDHPHRLSHSHPRRLSHSYLSISVTAIPQSQSNHFSISVTATRRISHSYSSPSQSNHLSISVTAIPHRLSHSHPVVSVRPPHAPAVSRRGQS